MPIDSEPAPTGPGRSPAIAAGLSFLWPGLGQFFLGRRVAATILLLPALAAVLLAVIQLDQGVVMFAASLWDASYFLAVAAGVALFGIWRMVAVGHAFVLGSRGRRVRRPEVAFVSALLIAVVSMHGLLVAGAWEWYETSVSIQNNDLFAFASTSDATDAPTPSLAAGPLGTSSIPPGSSAAPTSTTTTRPTAPTPARPPNPNRITFLIVGLDFMTGRSHSLTDTLILVSIDKSTEKVSIVSVPRDTAGFDLYYGGWVGPSFKINTLLSAATSSTFGSPDPPMKTLENEIGFLVGIPVNYYAAIDLEGFSKVIDALGGVDVVNPRAINDPFTGTFVPAGPVHLNGTNALKYVRSREGTGDTDYTRAGRQQDVLVAVERKVASPAVLPQLATLLSLAGQIISTDFPLNKARNYVTMAQGVSTIEKCVLGPPYSFHPDSSTTGGSWTSRLDLGRVASLSVEMFGQESRYYGPYGAVPAPCGR